MQASMAQPASEHPHWDDTNRPSKRQRMENRNEPENSDRSYRRRSPPARDGRTDSYRPRADWTANRSYDTYRPSGPRNRQRRRSASPDRDSPSESHAQSKNKKSLKERKENPSTRIRSLRNLLGRGRLPATVHQEKERELAALLFEQQKETIRQNGKKNLKRYHFVRFVERQKANRTLKQLKQQQEKGDVSEDLEQRIHEAEVDLNYTIYTPLAQKYIAMYAREDSKEGKPLPLPRNLSRMNKQDYAILSEEQRNEIEQTSMEAAELLHLVDGGKGVKPPMWYVVESKMKEGQKALEKLRDEQAKADAKADLVVGTGSKKIPDWLNDDGTINPEDLDSESDEDGGAAVSGADKDDEMSDGDGGFFEKR